MKKHDFILIGAVLAIAAVIFGILYFGGNGGQYVEIEIDGKITQSLPLDRDAELEIKTEKNGVNTLVIRDGYAAVTDANCPDKICVHHRKINRNGESIICLPHRVVISISDKSNAEEIDSVS